MQIVRMRGGSRFSAVGTDTQWGVVQLSLLRKVAVMVQSADGWTVDGEEAI